MLSYLFQIAHALPKYDKLLERRYSKLIDVVESSPNTEISDMAEKSIIYSRHPLALDSKIHLLKVNKWTMLFERLAQSIISSQSIRGVQSLVDYVLKSPKRDDYNKAVVLFSLREAKARDWTGPLFDVIKPYLNDIDKARPISISD